MYKVVMNYPDGTTHEEDEIFETEEEASAYGLVMCSDYTAGGEVLQLMKTGDYDPELAEDDRADFEVIDVFWIELRPNGIGDVCIGNGNAIDEPGDLMTTADVKLIMRDHSARYIVRDHREAVRAIRAGRLRNLFAADERD